MDVWILLATSLVYILFILVCHTVFGLKCFGPADAAFPRRKASLFFIELNSFMKETVHKQLKTVFETESLMLLFDSVTDCEDQLPPNFKLFFILTFYIISL